MPRSPICLYDNCTASWREADEISFLGQRPEQEGYEFALAHPEIIEYIACYCGCGLAVKHKSNLDCYMRGVNGDGAVVFDNHAVSCGICLNITLDAKRLGSEVNSLKEIRGRIDERYWQMGPGTSTPEPPLKTVQFAVERTGVFKFTATFCAATNMG